MVVNVGSRDRGVQVCGTDEKRLTRQYSSKGVESGERMNGVKIKSKERINRTRVCGSRNQQIYTANRDGASGSEWVESKIGDGKRMMSVR